ncbi:MAG: hypothetical protein GTN93_32095, partial [Anaerolineae bacterium]|nr:hypothetical protein [Anaerolineae bacterium]
MRVKMPILACAAFAATLWATLVPPVQPACAQDERTPSSALQASNAFNPNVSAIGWFQAQIGRPIEEVDEAFRLEEAEVAFQAVVDPYARADVFVAVGHHGVELEEAYLTWFRLPLDL